MQISQQGRRFVVIDDFLDQETFASARGMFSRAIFSRVESVIAPQEDGHAFRSKGVHFRDEVSDVGVGARPRVYEELVRRIHHERDFFGEWRTDWNRIGFTFWKYPAGSRLGWHNDAGNGRRGEFILFLHDEWRPSWGGELMLLDVAPEELHWDTAAGDGLVARMEALLGSCPVNPVAIAPRPNRLVLVLADTIHQIHRVDRTAGDAMRCTLTGFVSQDTRSDVDTAAVRENVAQKLGVR
jgi:hypothetical protein